MNLKLMMNLSKTNEQAFEALIERALVGSTHEERTASGQNDVESQSPNAQQYNWGLPKDMDKKLAIDLRRLWAFLESTQHEVLKEYKGKNLKSELPKRISKDIETFGVIKVLREGVDVDNIHLSLFYPKPSAADSETSKLKYAQNQFSLTRQQTFSVANPGLEIDMVLFVNGLPIFTFELKNPWTHQTAKYDGQKQYKSTERNPKETLLNFGRCLAHFTMDKDEVFFTTRLNLDKTYFMPFNKGLPNGQGAGNQDRVYVGTNPAKGHRGRHHHELRLLRLRRGQDPKEGAAHHEERQEVDLPALSSAGCGKQIGRRCGGNGSGEDLPHRAFCRFG